MSTPEITRKPAPEIPSAHPFRVYEEDPTLIEIINANNMKEIGGGAAIEPLPEPQTTNKTIFVAEKNLVQKEGADVLIAAAEKEAALTATINMAEKSTAETLLNSTCKGVADSVVVTGITYPLDSKTTQNMLSESVAEKTKLTSKDAKQIVSSKSDQKKMSEIAKIFQNLRRLYTGYEVKVIANLPANLVFYGFYSASNEYLKKNWTDRPELTNPVALTVATLADTLVYNPFSVVLTRLQADPANNKNAREVLKKILQDEKGRNHIRTMINLAKTSERGFFTSYLRNLAYLLPYFSFLDIIQTAMSKGRKDTPALQQLVDSTVAGLVSGFLAASFAFPFDRIQKEKKFATKNISSLEIALKILRSPGGWKNFYKGALIGIVYRQPLYGITTAVVLKTVDISLEKYLKNKAEKEQQTMTSGQKPVETNEMDFSDIDEAAVLAQIVKDAATATYCYAVLKFDEMKSKTEENPIFQDLPFSLLSIAASAKTVWDKLQSFNPFAEENKEFVERRKHPIESYRNHFGKDRPYISKVTKIEEIKEDGSSHALNSADSFERIASSASLF